MEFFHPLFLSRLEFHKVVFWALFFFCFFFFINDLSDWKILYLFADDSTLCRTISHSSDRQAAVSSLSVDLDRITNWFNTWNMSFNVDKSHTLTMSLQMDRLEPPPIYFLNNPLEEVLSFKILGFTICHDLSWESHNSNLASRASRRLGILSRAKSFLGPPELLTTYKAFVHSLMEYCSPLWAGAPASHLSRFHVVETKAFRIIAISRDEAESLGFLLSHCRQVGGVSIFYRLLSGLTPPPIPRSVCDMFPPYFRRALKVRQKLLLNYQNHESLLTFTLSFLVLPAFGINSLTLFNPILPSRRSKQLFTTIYHPPSKLSIFSTPVNPTQTHLLQIPCFPSSKSL
uniref:Reverse transcriptase domain-containing protein n=1 Tax=Eptatretus burgeri TaxID=7764 RepID=A0A8C4NF36_EPTBU